MHRPTLILVQSKLAEARHNECCATSRRIRKFLSNETLGKVDPLNSSFMRSNYSVNLNLLQPFRTLREIPRFLDQSSVDRFLEMLDIPDSN